MLHLMSFDRDAPFLGKIRFNENTVFTGLLESIAAFSTVIQICKS